MVKQTLRYFRPYLEDLDASCLKLASATKTPLLVCNASFMLATIILGRDV